MDAIHYKIKENHQYITKAAYVVLGINLDGQKDILGIWIGENESSKFWLNVLNKLKTRGIKDVFLFCVDGLTGSDKLLKRLFRTHKSSVASFIRYAQAQGLSATNTSRS